LLIIDVWYWRLALNINCVVSAKVKK